MSSIEWTDKTWNPIVGCSIPTIEVDGKTRVRPGCANCYACKDSPHRFAAKYDREGVIVLRGKAKREGLTFVPRTPDGKSLGRGAQWTGEIRCLPWALDVPLRRKKPTTWFVNSLSDVFHESVVGCEEGRRFIAAMFGVMAATRQHTYQLLTKRDARDWFAWLEEVAPIGGQTEFCVGCAEDLGVDFGDRFVIGTWPLLNVWIGTSVEDQAAADWAIPHLIETPAAVRFLSVEPMLGPVNLGEWFERHAWCQTCGRPEGQHHKKCATKAGHLHFTYGDTQSVKHMKGQVTPGRPSVNWVICGGESGPGARPMYPDWARDLRDQCVAAGVPFFFKQWGAWGWGDQLPDETVRVIDAGDTPEILDQRRPIRLGKKATGRELDGRTWDEMPT